MAFKHYGRVVLTTVDDGRTDDTVEVIDADDISMLYDALDILDPEDQARKERLMRVFRKELSHGE